MNTPVLDHLDRDVVDSVLQMGGGYVLDFSDRTFAEFFNDFGVPIDAEPYSAHGTSKANRLRTFLRMSPPDLIGRVLAALLERRLLKEANDAARPAGGRYQGRQAPRIREPELQRYRGILSRLGVAAAPPQSSQSFAEPSESDLLRRVFNPNTLAQLPMDPALVSILAARMEEAQACIRSKALLAAVILCGSVLEGICLGVGARDPERANRAYAAKFNRAPPKFYDWKLREWIDVLASLGDLSPNVEKFGHALRDFRNYVHPAEQLAHRFAPDQHTARIGFQVVVAAIEDLLRASKP